MDDALSWPLRRRRAEGRDDAPRSGASARFGGDGRDEPVLIAVVHGPVEAEMARDALAEARIPAYVKQHSLGQIYGLSVGNFGAAEVWVAPPLAESARDVLIGVGLLDPDDEPR